MDTNERGAGVIKFSLWGIPVEIRISTWILLAILGGGLGVSDGSSLASTLIFIVAGALCLLAHEMGHALTGRHFTKFTPWVTLGGLGGATFYPVPPHTRMHYFLTVLAGPMASFIFGMAVALIMGIQCGNPMAGLNYYLLAPLGLQEHIPTEQLYAILSAFYDVSFDGSARSSFIFEVYSMTLAISMWWTLFNLLPILPMDGGHLVRTLTGNIRLTAALGLALCVLLLVPCVTSKYYFMVMLLAYFGVINFQLLRSPNGGLGNE